MTWPRMTIAQATERVAMGPFGSSIKVSTFVPKGVPVISGQHLRGSRVDDSPGHNFVTEEHADQLRKANVQKGDVILTHAGNIGQVAYVPESAAYDRYVISQRQFYIRCNRSVLTPEFLTYYFHSTEGHYALMANAVQTGVPSLAQPVSYVRTIEVPVPPLPAQHAIVNAIGLLDDKIESNCRIIDLAPRIIRAQVEKALQVGSAKLPVASLAKFVNGGAYTKGASGTGRMVLRIAELNSGPGRSTVYNDIDVPDEKLARPGDILMSWSGSLGVYRWCRDEAIINQHIFKVIPAEYPPWLVADRLDAIISVFQGIAKDKATTMGHIQRGDLESTLVDVPDPAYIADMQDGISLLWSRLLVAERENLRLASLRDSLLPALISGRMIPSAAPPRGMGVAV
jgi:type I restriction enzyme S subunit